jgi:hypothetical protein
VRRAKEEKGDFKGNVESKGNLGLKGNLESKAKEMNKGNQESKGKKGNLGSRLLRAKGVKGDFKGLRD